MNNSNRPKHTPGPWTVAKADADIPLFDVRLKGDESTDDTLVCQMYEPGGQGVQRANARLIAAAPELIAFALQVQSEYVKGVVGLTNSSLELLYKAIAKATGGAE